MTTPSLIGQYRILRKIGAGGMGLVYLGEHTLLGRRAAIKTLLPAVAANAEIVERFFNEARATSAISDPGVIQIFDFGYHVDGTAYIVMELLEGEALSARIDRLGKLPLGDALRIARQIAGSLAAAHTRDIVHRDLKPENIFLVHDAEAQGGERSKILDFGICKVGSGDATVTQSGAMVGTPVYMSPEQCRGAGGVDHRADIYAFGCLVFHLVTGRPPFVGDAPGELIVAHLREDAPPASQFVPELPLALDALLLRCLAKDPADRFASMTELSAALAELAVQRGGSGPVVQAVAPQMSLGRGFQSMYDANLVALLGTGTRGVPLTSTLRAKLNFAPTPAPNEDFEGEDAPIEIPPHRRAGVRAALAGVLMIGVVLGLVATSLVIDGHDHHASAEASLPAQARPPVEGAPDPAVVAAPTVATPPAAAIAAPAAAPSLEPASAPPPSTQPAPSAPSASIATLGRNLDPRSPETAEPRRREARDVKTAATKPRTRIAPAPAPRAPQPASTPAVSSPSPSSPSPPAPTEDLYDTR